MELERDLREVTLAYDDLLDEKEYLEMNFSSSSDGSDDGVRAQPPVSRADASPAVDGDGDATQLLLMEAESKARVGVLVCVLVGRDQLVMSIY